MAGVSSSIVNVRRWLGVAVVASQSGRPDVYVGAMDAAVKTGFSLTAASYTLFVSNMQRGTVTIAAGANSSSNASISSVNANKAYCHDNGFVDGASSTAGYVNSRIALGSATVVNAYRGTGNVDGNSTASTHGFEVGDHV